MECVTELVEERVHLIKGHQRRVAICRLWNVHVVDHNWQLAKES